MKIPHQVKKFFPFILFFIILAIFSPLLEPIINPSKTFFFGDLTTSFGGDSAEFISNRTLYVFETPHSIPSFEYIRYPHLFSVLILGASAVGLTESFVWATLSLIAITLGYIGIFKLVKLMVGKQNLLFYILLTAISFFYFFNFYSVTRIIHLFIWHTYLIFPLFIYLGLSIKQKFKVSTILAYSLLLITYGLIPHGVIYMGVFHLIVFILMLATTKDWKNDWLFFLIPIASFLICNIHIILGFLTSIQGYPIKINLDELNFLSTNGSLFNTLSFANNWWIYFDNSRLFQNLPYIFSGLIISIMSICGLIGLLTQAVINKDKKVTGFLVSLFTILILILVVSCGMNVTATQNLAEYLASKNSLSVLSLVREWARIAILLPAIFTLVLLLCIQKFKKYKWHIVAIFCGSVAVNLITSPSNIYLNSFYKPAELPKQMVELAESISRNSKILWIRPTNIKKTIGLELSDWSNTKTAAHTVETNIGSQYGHPFIGQPLMTRYLKSNTVSESLLARLNINYIIKRKDYQTEGTPEFSIYNDSNDFIEGEYFDVNSFRLDPNQAFLVDNPVLVTDYYKTPEHWDLLYQNGLDGYITEQPHTGYTNLLLRKEGDTYNNLLLYEILRTKRYQIIEPYKYSLQLDPSNTWSAGKTSNLIHDEFNLYAEELGIYNYQDDYDMGVLFTNASPKPSEYALEHALPIETYKFYLDSGFDQISALNNIDESDREISKTEHGALFKVTQNDPGWDTIKFPVIEAQNGNYLKFKLFAELRDSINPHLKLVLLDTNGYKIKDVFLKTLEIGQSEVSTEYYLTDSDVSKVQLELWHGNNYPNESTTAIEVQQLQIYKLEQQLEFESISIDSKLEYGKSGKYYMFARVLKSPKSQKLGVTINSGTIEIETNSMQNSTFEWIPLGKHYIQDNIEIQLQNIDGFNAINTIVVIPEAEYETKNDENIQEFKEQFDGEIIISQDDTGSASLLTQNQYQEDISDQRTYDAELEQISPIKWEGEISTRNQSILTFNELYDPNWKLLLDNGEDRLEAKHFKVFGYLNGYQIPEGFNGNVTVVYENGGSILALKIMSLIFFNLLIGGYLLTLRTKR